MQLQEVKKQTNRQEWARMVMACRNSGLGVQKWCDQNGINTKTYYYRQRRVFEALSSQQLNRSSMAMAPASNCVEFVPLRPVSRTSDSVKLHLSDCTLEIPEGIDADTLRTILQVIREC